MDFRYAGDSTVRNIPTQGAVLQFKGHWTFFCRYRPLYTVSEDRNNPINLDTGESCLCIVIPTKRALCTDLATPSSHRAIIIIKSTIFFNGSSI